jgi:dolichol kinase
MDNNLPPELKLSFKGEFYRKLLHISSSAIPIVYYFIDNKSIVLSILVPITVLMLLIEITKYKSNFIYDIYLKFFKHMLRNHEFDRKKFRINGATWLLVGDVIAIILFPKIIAVTGMLLLSLADSFSGIIGRLYGKKEYAPNRTYIGSLTFLIVGIIIAFSAPKYNYSLKEYLIALITVVITTVVDGMKLPTDDNFAIPIVSSALLYVLYMLFFPGIFG